MNIKSLNDRAAINAGPVNSAGMSATSATRDGISLSGEGAKDSPEAIAKAAEKFEALLIQQMSKAMWDTINVRGTLLGSRDEETYRDMYNEMLADNLAHGQGIGIKQVIVKELERKAYAQSSSMDSASKLKVRE